MLLINKWWRHMHMKQSVTRGNCATALLTDHALLSSGYTTGESGEAVIGVDTPSQIDINLWSNFLYWRFFALL